MRKIGINPSAGLVQIYFLGVLGTIVEWYDFSIYGHFSSLFARLFFANKAQWLSQILVYAIFFASYLARPVGALIYGYIGDNLGRRVALLLSIAMMTISMIMMMVLPSEKVLGSVAPLLLLIFRIIQGLSAGGETTGAFVYVLESVERKRYGLFGGLTLAVITCGILFGAAMAALLTNVLTDQQLISWGWRLAYLCGAILGLVILLLRAFMPESIAFSRFQQSSQDSRQPLMDESVLKRVFFHYKYVLLLIVAFVALASTSVYFTLFYLPQYTHRYLSIKLSSVMISSTIFTLCVVALEIFFGYVSDYIGKKRVMVIAGLCLLLFSYPIFELTLINSWAALVIVPLIFTILISLYQAPMPGVMIELAPVEIRYTLVSLGYNISTALFGGSTMLISAMLVHRFHNRLVPAFYLMAVALLSLAALFGLNRLKAHHSSTENSQNN